MLYFRIFFLLLIQTTLCEQGWIFDKEVKAGPTFKRFLAINNSTLVVQTSNNIYLAPFNDPNIVKQTVVSNIPQNVAIAQWTYKQSYLYTIYNYLHYEEYDSMKKLKVDEIDNISCFFKLNELIYFYNPLISTNLLIYNLTNGTISYGPYLISKSKELYTMAVQMNTLFNHLVICIDSTLFFIDMKSMTVINSFFNEINGQQVQILISPQGKYVSLISLKTKTVFIFDQKVQQYSYIYALSWQNDLPFYFGLTFNEEIQSCIGIMMKKYLNVYFKLLLELDCSETYDKIIDRVDPINHGIRYLGGQDKDILYSVERQYFSNITVFKHQITENGFKLISKQSLPLDSEYNVVKIYSVTNKELLIFKEQRIEILILQLSSTQYKCTKQIKQNILFSKKVRLVYLQPSQKLLYFLFQRDRTILLWINLQTCKFGSKTFQNNIGQIFFMNGRTYLEQSAVSNYILLLEQQSKQIEKRFISLTAQNIVLYDAFFGILLEGNMYYVCRYDSQFKIIKKSQIRCLNGFSYLKKGSHHLTAICGNQYHLYDFDLLYLGSSYVNQTQINCFYVQETFNPSLRVALLAGELHFNIFKQWKLKMEQEGSVMIPASNFYFRNKSDAVAIGKEKAKFYMSHYSYADNRFQEISRLSLELKVGQAQVTNPSLRWSCGKRYVLLKYFSLLDSINIYINVYETFPFKLVYSHRLSMLQFSNRISFDQFNAYLDCNNILTISTYSNIEVVDLNKRKSILLENFKDISSVVLSNDAQTAVILGEDFKNVKLIQVRSFAGSVIDRFVNHIYDSQSKAFFANATLFILSQNNLYHQARDSILISTSIVDCSYFGQFYLLCLTLDGKIITINSTKPSQLFQNIVDSSDKHILVSNCTLIVYDRKDLEIYSSLDTFSLIQSISLTQRRIDDLTVSPDLKKMITFDRISKSFTYWNNQSCPSLSYLKNGKCECVQDLVEGVCKCKKAHFDFQGQCTECQFYCEQCGNSAGDCLMMSTAGILMIVGLALIVVFIGASIFYCLHKHTKKGKKTQAMSQLLEQISSVNE